MGLYNDSVLQSLLPHLKGRNEGLTFIAQEVLTGSVTSVSFTSVPDYFTHLLTIIQTRTDSVAEGDRVTIQFNGDGTANYDTQNIQANDTTLSGAGARATSTSAIARAEAANSRASNFSPGYILIPFYAGSQEKQAVSIPSVRYGDVSADADIFLSIYTVRWRNTNAITQIDFAPVTGTNFVSGCKFGLYGIR